MSDETHNPLPAIAEADIGGTMVQTTNGRDLHRSLKVGRDFSTWIKGRIAEYGFTDGVDYVIESAPPIRGAGNRGAKDEYHLTLDMAKELAMVENNEEGRRVRRYFIRIEAKARAGIALKPANQNLAREARLFLKQAMSVAKIAGLTGNSMLIAANRATRAAVGFDHMAEMGVKYLEAPDNDVLLTATEIGKRLGAVSAVRVNHLLAEHGFQTGERDAKGHAMWLPTEKGVAAGGQMVEVERSNKTGQARQLRWALRIVDILRDLIEGRAA